MPGRILAVISMILLVAGLDADARSEATLEAASRAPVLSNAPRASATAGQQARQTEGAGAEEADESKEPAWQDNCIDTSSRCEMWASNGECESNPEFMSIGCCSSCDPGSPNRAHATRCQDNDSFCAEWADLGECISRPEFMLVECCKSCHPHVSSADARTPVPPFGPYSNHTIVEILQAASLPPFGVYAGRSILPKAAFGVYASGKKKCAPFGVYAGQGRDTM